MDIIDRYHANRLWHINGNIIISGVFSAIVVATIVHLSEVFMWKNISHIVAFSAILDIILDPVIFFILHYKSSSHKIKDLSRSYFIKDAITIHGHKMVLSVVYYAMAAP